MTESHPRRLALDLLDRYLSNECTAAEIVTVETWLTADPANREVLRGMRELRVVQGALSPEQIDSAWKDFVITWMQTPARRPEVKRTSSHSPRPSIQHTSAGWRTIVVAAAIAVIAGAGGGFFATRFNTPDRAVASSAVRTFSTVKGQRATIQLVDGSRVTLGPESRVELAPEFSSGVRTIRVTGAAFFEVTHHPASPFVVHSGNAIVQAIGTAFSVVRYPQDSSVHVVVSQGKVAVRGEASDVASFSDRSVVLAQGDAAEFITPEQIAVRRNVDVENELAWVNGQLRFRRTPLADVARVLEQWYDVSVVIPDSALAKQRVTATFGREGIAEIVTQLTKALGVRYRVHGRAFVIQSQP